MEMEQPPPSEIETQTPGLKVFPSNKGKYVAAYKGFIYNFHVTGSNKQILRCCQYKTNCHGRIHLSMSYKKIINEEIAEFSKHNHAGDQGAVDAKYHQWRLKSAAKSSSDTTSSLIAIEMQQMPQSSQDSLPKLESIRRTIRNARVDSTLPNKVFSREEIPDTLASHFKTSTGELFLKYDSASHPPYKKKDRFLIFTTDRNLEFLQQSEHWFADGTFRTSPSLFDQLYIIHGTKKINDNYVGLPLVYVLTPNRKSETYRSVLNALGTLKSGLAPTTVMSDYVIMYDYGSNQCIFNRVPGCSTAWLLFPLRPV